MRLFSIIAIITIFTSVSSGDSKLPYRQLIEGQPLTPTGVTFSGVGSFRAEGVGDLTVDVNGTVLFCNVTGQQVVVSPGLKLEYGPVEKIMAGKKITRVGYHGKGTIKIIGGQFRAVHFFGSKCSGKFFGVGTFQFTGHGVSTMTGEKTMPWYESTAQIWVPSPPQRAVPNRKHPGVEKSLPEKDR